MKWRVRNQWLGRARRKGVRDKYFIEINREKKRRFKIQLRFLSCKLIGFNQANCYKQLAGIIFWRECKRVNLDKTLVQNFWNEDRKWWQRISEKTDE